MKDKVLAGDLVEICPGPCEHRLCNDARMYASLGINPLGAYERKTVHVQLQPDVEGIKADNRESESAVQPEAR
jgi:hypothetical protein